MFASNLEYHYSVKLNQVVASPGGCVDPACNGQLGRSVVSDEIRVYEILELHFCITIHGTLLYVTLGHS